MTVYLLQNLKDAMKQFFAIKNHKHQKDDIENFPKTMPPSEHTHDFTHTHSINDIVGLSSTEETSKLEIQMLMNILGINCAPEDVIVLENGPQGYSQYGAQVIPLYYHQGDYVYIKSDGKLYYIETEGENGKYKIINNTNASDVQDSLDSNAVDKPLSANQGKILNDNINAIKNHNTNWTQGTLINGTGSFQGMIRNGFVIIKFNVTTGVIPSSPFALGYFPKTFYAHGGTIEGTAKTYKGGWSKVSTVMVDNTPNETLLSIYNESAVESGTGFVGLIVYPVANY